MRQFGGGPSSSTSKGMTGFDITTRFFDMLADAISELHDTLKLEFVVSDVIKGTPQLVAGDLGSRPKGFPRSYSRMWLSNVP